MVVDYDGDALFFILPPGLRERRCAKPVFILPPQLASLLAGQMPDRPCVVRLAKCFAGSRVVSALVRIFLLLRVICNSPWTLI